MSEVNEAAPEAVDAVFNADDFEVIVSIAGEPPAERNEGGMLFRAATDEDEAVDTMTVRLVDASGAEEPRLIPLFYVDPAMALSVYAERHSAEDSEVDLFGGLLADADVFGAGEDADQEVSAALAEVERDLGGEG